MGMADPDRPADYLRNGLATPALVRIVPELEEVLGAYAAQIGGDFEGYRGHCYRVLNFCVALAPGPVRCLRKLAIATAFHDIGIWTHKTFDYLEPSTRVAADYLARSGAGDWIEEVGLMIREHHKIRPVGEPARMFVESFRRADWVDVSRGLLAFGLPRRLIREAFAIWPSAGFHRKLIQLSWERFKSHPLSPLPMLKL